MNLALGFAACAHRRQKRKYTSEPYVNHCVRVAELVRGTRLLDVGLRHAAILHDVVEDTDVTVEELREVFGGRVADLVLEVTNISRPEDGNRAFRKQLELEHLSRTSADAATIKLADIIDNTRDVALHDKKFAKVYLREKSAVLEVLTHGDNRLWNMASRQVASLIEDLD